MLTIEEINALSTEECAAMNKKLARRALTQFFGMQALKWVFIIGVTHSLGKAFKNSAEAS